MRMQNLKENIIKHYEKIKLNSKISEIDNQIINLFVAEGYGTATSLRRKGVSRDAINKYLKDDVNERILKLIAIKEDLQSEFENKFKKKEEIQAKKEIEFKNADNLISRYR